MQRLYRAILRLYPAEYRAAFAPEMIEVSAEASSNYKERGLLERLSFGCCEYAGLVKGAVVEHAARWAAHEAYITSRCASRQNLAVLEDRDEIVEVRQRLDHLIRSMEFAIAHHNFPKARSYSDEERVTRARLERLLHGYGSASEHV